MIANVINVIFAGAAARWLEIAAIGPEVAVANWNMYSHAVPPAVYVVAAARVDDVHEGRVLTVQTLGAARVVEGQSGRVQTCYPANGAVERKGSDASNMGAETVSDDVQLEEVLLPQLDEHVQQRRSLGRNSRYTCCSVDERNVVVGGASVVFDGEDVTIFKLEQF